MEKISFNIDGGGSEQLYVLEQTTISSFTYILVTDKEEGNADCWILKEIRTDGGDVVYEEIEDEQELDAVAAVFAQMLDEDTSIEY